MPKNYKLSNGEYAQLPDDIPESEQYKALAALEASIQKKGGKEPANDKQDQSLGQKLLKSMESPKTPSEGHQNFYNLLKNLGAGAGQLFSGSNRYAINTTPKKQEEPTNFNQAFGLKPENVSHFQQALPGAALSFAIPNPIQRAGQAAGLLERGLRLGGRAGVEGIKDSLIAAKINPENPEESAKTVAPYSAGGSALADLVSSSQPGARVARSLLGPAAGGGAGYYLARDKPLPTRAAATLGGAFAGHGLGVGLLRGINGPRQFMEEAGGLLNRSMGPAERHAYEIGHEAFDRANIPGTLAQKTESAQHRTHQANAARTPEDVQRAQDFNRHQEMATEFESRGVKRDIFDEARDEALQRDYPNTWRNYDHSVTESIGNGYRQRGDRQFQAAENSLLSEPERASQYEGMDPNSLEYLDGIHRMAQERANRIEAYLANPPPLAPGQNPLFTRSDLHAAQRFDRDLVRELDRSSHNNMYANVRREAEYKILGRNIEHHTPEQLRELFNNPRRMREFQHAIRDNEELAGRVNDLRIVLNRIHNNRMDVDAMARRLPREGLSLSSILTPIKTGKRVAERTVRAPYSRAAVDLMLDPNSGQLLHTLAQSNNSERLISGLARFMTKKKAQEKGKEAHKKGPMLNINIGGKDKPVFNIEEV